MLWAARGELHGGMGEEGGRKARGENKRNMLDIQYWKRLVKRNLWHTPNSPNASETEGKANFDGLNFEPRKGSLFLPRPHRFPSLNQCKSGSDSEP